MKPNIYYELIKKYFSDDYYKYVKELKYLKIVKQNNEGLYKNTKVQIEKFTH